MTTALTSVVRVLNINSTHKAILKEICDFANDDFVAWPSVELLAAVTGFSDRCCQEYMALDRKNGVLELYEDADIKKRSKIYVVNPEKMIEVYGIKPGLERLLPGRWAAPRGEPGSPQGVKRGEPGSPQPRTRFTPTLNQVHPNPEPGSPKPLRTIKEPSGGEISPTGGAAPEGAPPDAATTDPPPDGEPETLIGKWRRLEPMIVKRWGQGEYDAWFRIMVPAADDGAVLRLAAPTRFKADWFAKTFAARLGEMIHREIVVAPEKWAYAKAQQQRKTG